MIDDNSPDPLLLDRYLAEEVSHTERARVDAWLAVNPAAAALMRELPEQVSAGATMIDTNASWASLHERIARYASPTVA